MKFRTHHFFTQSLNYVNVAQTCLGERRERWQRIGVQWHEKDC